MNQLREFQHPADGWYQVEAKGYHPAVADDGSKVVQVIDDKACKSIVNRFNADAQAGRLPHGREMLIDHEHFQHDPKQETAAYGWANKLRVSPDGSGFEVFNPWTATGQEAVDGGTYRFTSTEYQGTVGDVFEEVPAGEIPAEVRNRYQGFKFLRPLRLTGLSLTNANNNKGQKAITITNRRSMDAPAAAVTVWNRQQKENSAAVLRVMAQDEQKKHGGTFDAAWRRVCNRCPEIVRRLNE